MNVVWGVIGIIVISLLWIVAVFLWIMIKVFKGEKTNKTIEVPKDKCECGDDHNLEETDYTYCDFCGSKVKKKTRKCPACKANLNN